MCDLCDYSNSIGNRVMGREGSNFNKGKIIILFFWVCLFLPVNLHAEKFISILYHNVYANVQGDRFAVDLLNFIEQMEYLRANNYHPVSIDDLIASKNRIRSLPEKAVLITIDDGLSSFYETIFPILKLYQYPAVVSVIGSWAEHGYYEDNSHHNHGKKGHNSNTNLAMNWKQIREIADSGLVEIASHSYNLHRGIVYNPQGNKAPPGSSFAYNPETRIYEDEDMFRKRIRKDLTRYVKLIKDKLGHAPRVMVWPYGEFNRIGIEEAKRLGMNINLSVLDGFADTDHLEIINRGIIINNPDISEFAHALEAGFMPQEPMRAIQIDLDLIYDPDPEVQEKNLGNLLDRLVEIRPNTVFLQAFSDMDGDGNVSEVYFPNRILPMKADLFNRAAHQIKTRTPVASVYAWLPLLSFQLPDNKERDELIVRENKDGIITPVKRGYLRLSPFSPAVREKVSMIYEDLAMHANIGGILFQDDAYLNDFEDFHPDALKAYEAEFGKPFSVDSVKSDTEKMQKWAEFKTMSLIKFTEDIARGVKRYRPNVKIARNIYARLMTQTESEIWFAQNYKAFLEHYDNVVLMAYPYLEEKKYPLKWLKRLAQIANSYPDGYKKTVFKLQTYDWNKEQWLSSKELRDYIDQLIISGVKHIAYYPDDYQMDKPGAKEIIKSFSLNTSPFFTTSP